LRQLRLEKLPCSLCCPSRRAPSGYRRFPDFAIAVEYSSAHRTDNRWFRECHRHLHPVLRSKTMTAVRLYRAEAELAKGALGDAGIPAMLQADTAGRMREHLAWSGPGFQVWGCEKRICPRRASSFTPRLTGQMLNFLTRMSHEPRGGALPKETPCPANSGSVSHQRPV